MIDGRSEELHLSTQPGVEADLPLCELELAVSVEVDLVCQHQPLAGGRDEVVSTVGELRQVGREEAHLELLGFIDHVRPVHRQGAQVRARLREADRADVDLVGLRSEGLCLEGHRPVDVRLELIRHADLDDAQVGQEDAVCPCFALDRRAGSDEVSTRVRDLDPGHASVGVDLGDEGGLGRDGLEELGREQLRGVRREHRADAMARLGQTEAFSDRAPQRRIVIISDMLQNSDAFTAYGGGGSMPANMPDAITVADTTMRRFGNILDGVSLEVRLIPRQRYVEMQRGALKEYWNDVFAELGVDVTWRDL